MFNADSRKGWQALADSLAKDRPSVGRKVRIIAGKHKGGIGMVTMHRWSKFFSLQYTTDAQLAFLEMAGRRGYFVQVNLGDQKVFCNAEYTEVIHE